MLPPDRAFQAAVAAHKAGRFTAAEVAYRRVLRQRPDDPAALYHLGLLHFHRGEIAAALQCVSRSLEQSPAHAHVWNTFGGMLIAAKRTDDAKEAYRKATEAGPQLAEGWYNLGVCLRDEGHFDAAISHFREAIARQPGYFQAYGALAVMLYRLGRVREAAEIYRLWSLRDPSNAYAGHMAAATSGQNAPSRAPDDYVQQFFDDFADEFDSSIERLGYRGPGLIAKVLAEHTAQRSALDVLDAGCGTGLCAPLIREQCKSLVGVDLSPKMLEQARVRGGYDELVAAELGAFMRARPNAFDAIISCDTLIYSGELQEPLEAAYQALRSSGLFVFTLEALPQDSGLDYKLETHGRYSHREDYVRHTLLAVGFEPQALLYETLREERDQKVTGLLIVAHRPAAAG